MIVKLFIYSSIWLLYMKHWLINSKKCWLLLDAFWALYRLWIGRSVQHMPVSNFFISFICFNDEYKTFSNCSLTLHQIRWSQFVHSEHWSLVNRQICSVHACRYDRIGYDSKTFIYSSIWLFYITHWLLTL